MQQVVLKLHVIHQVMTYKPSTCGVNQRTVFMIHRLLLLHLLLRQHVKLVLVVKFAMILKRGVLFNVKKTLKSYLDLVFIIRQVWKVQKVVHWKKIWTLSVNTGQDHVLFRMVLIQQDQMLLCCTQCVLVHWILKCRTVMNWSWKQLIPMVWLGVVLLLS